MQAIRGDIHVAVDYGAEPEEMTLREAVEYYKKVIRVSAELGTLTGLELKHVDQAWGFLVGKLAGREGIPSGWLTYLLGELARSETRSAELALEASE